MKEVENVVVAVRRDNKFLLLKRSSLETNSNFVEFPAGKVEHGELFLDAAIRELKEETGIVAKESELEFMGYTYRPKLNSQKLVKSAIFVLNKEVEEKIVLSEEHDSYVWASLRDILPINNLGFETIRGLNILLSNSTSHGLKSNRITSDKFEPIIYDKNNYLSELQSLRELFRSKISNSTKDISHSAAELIDIVVDSTYYLLLNKRVVPRCDRFYSSSLFALLFNNEIPFKLLRLEERALLNKGFDYSSFNLVIELSHKFFKESKWFYS